MILKYIYRGIALFFFGLGMYFCFTMPGESQLVIQQDCNLHQENEGKFVVISGKPTFSGKTADKELKLSIRGPILRRVVQRDKSYDGKKYPYTLRGKDFVSEITLNNGTLPLSAEFTQMLAADAKQIKAKGLDFSQSYDGGWMNVRTLPQPCTPPGFAYQTSKFVVEGGPTYEISYKGFGILKNIGTFTACGLQKDGKLTPKGNTTTIFTDRSIDTQRLKRRFRQEGRYAMLGALFCSLPFFTLGFAKVPE